MEFGVTFLEVFVQYLVASVVKKAHVTVFSNFLHNQLVSVSLHFSFNSRRILQLRTTRNDPRSPTPLGLGCCHET